jgi:putative sigma-54 modulation protein
MQINIEGHHVDLTESMQDYIQSKMAKIERHFDQVVDIRVVLSVEKLRQKAEATVHVAGNNLHAHEENQDMYAAIDLLVDKLDRQVKKHKEKLTKHRP